jgi:Protein of unknown function (DUF2974)
MGISSDKPDLFRAILSMDAYNRGYGSGMGNPNTGLGGARIGIATIRTDALPSGYEAASFFAQAYKLDYGPTIISYRGTDSSPADVPTGYGIGAGMPVGSFSYQGELALRFFNAVQASGTAGTIETTGHSLGGGLAGFVAALKNVDARLFDQMPFKAAVEHFYYLINAIETNPDSIAEINAAMALIPLIYGTNSPQVRPSLNEHRHLNLKGCNIKNWHNIQSGNR